MFVLYVVISRGLPQPTGACTAKQSVNTPTHCIQSLSTPQLGTHTTWRKQGDCTHTHTQQLPSVLVTFFEVPWSDPTDICPEVSHSFPRPNKLVQQGVSMGVDNGTPKESSRSQRQLGMSWHDWTRVRQLQQTTSHVHSVQYSDIYLKGGKVKV